MKARFPLTRLSLIALSGYILNVSMPGVLLSQTEELLDPANDVGHVAGDLIVQDSLVIEGAAENVVLSLGSGGTDGANGVESLQYHFTDDGVDSLTLNNISYRPKVLWSWDAIEQGSWDGVSYLTRPLMELEGSSGGTSLTLHSSDQTGLIELLPGNTGTGSKIQIDGVDVLTDGAFATANSLGGALNYGLHSTAGGRGLVAWDGTFNTTTNLWESVNTGAGVDFAAAFGRGRASNDYAFATGRSIASGYASAAFGNSQATTDGAFATGAAVASGVNSFAAGGAKAKGTLSFAFGDYNNIAHGLTSFAGGNVTRAGGGFSFAFGHGTRTGKWNSNTVGTAGWSEYIGGGAEAIAIGREALADENQSISIGTDTRAQSFAGSAALGWRNSSYAHAATALGVATRNHWYGAITLGILNEFNYQAHPNSAKYYFHDDPLLVLGNGLWQPSTYISTNEGVGNNTDPRHSQYKSNAMVVYKDGTTEIRTNHRSGTDRPLFRLIDGSAVPGSWSAWMYGNTVFAVEKSGETRIKGNSYVPTGAMLLEVADASDSANPVTRFAVTKDEGVEIGQSLTVGEGITATNGLSNIRVGQVDEYGNSIGLGDLSMGQFTATN